MPNNKQDFLTSIVGTPFTCFAAYQQGRKTRTRFWLNKIANNKANDEKVVKALRKKGWKVITVWECRLKPGKVEKILFSLIKKILS